MASDSISTCSSFRPCQIIIITVIMLYTARMIFNFCSVLVLLLSFTKYAYSFPAGAPISVCGSLIPTGHSGTGQANDAPGGFYIYSDLFNNNAGAYVADTTYNVTLEAGMSGTIFKGFVIQARDAGSTSLIGSFTILDSSNSQTLTCSSDPDSTVTHTNNNDKTTIMFQWTSPNTPGTVEIRYTVVTDRNEDYYGNLNAAENRPPCPFPPTAFGDHLFRFGLPEGCSGSACNYYVGLNVNEDDPDYLDVYLDGVANGWVAIGFSQDQQMGDDDVLGCSSLTALDTWNPSPRQTPNIADNDTVNTCQHSLSVENGRITCSFSRLIEGGDTGTDYNLNDTFWLFYATSSNAGSGNFFPMHSSTPTISQRMYNPVSDMSQTQEMNNTTTDNITNPCSFNPGISGDYAFTYGSPGSNYYVATRINPYDGDYLDFILEGVADGWVAIGFSKDQQMQEDDVLGCRVSDDVVIAVDTWNPAPRRTANVMDATQTDICMHSGSFVDGRITCRFSRRIIGSDIGQDYNLTDSFYLFYGLRAASQPSDVASLGYHTMNGGATPTISANLEAVIAPTCPSGPGSDVLYTFEYRQSDGNYILQTRVNPYNTSYLDIHLEGNALGWVALGLSTNTQMEQDDVIGCIADGDNVFVLDAWNPTGRYTPNVADNSQEDICMHSGSITNGNISCTFSRLMNGSNPTQDYSFNETFYYLFYGLRTSVQLNSHTNFASHIANGRPSISINKTNIVTGETGAGVVLSPTVAIQILLILGAAMLMMI